MKESNDEIVELLKEIKEILHEIRRNTSSYT